MIKGVVLDLDGVVYFGSRPAKGVVAAIGLIRRAGLRLCFLTNNSARSRRGIIRKLAGLGIRAELDEVMTSGYAAARYLARARARRVMVLGTGELAGEFRRLGLPLTRRPACSHLVVGFDPRFNYERLAVGLTALLGGARFVACNEVPNYPVEGGRLVPGLGAIVGALTAAAGRGPDVVIGKPRLGMLRELAADWRLLPAEILVVGDDPAIEIAMARDFGARSVLVGGRRPGSARPDFRIQAIGGLWPVLEKLI